MTTGMLVWLTGLPCAGKTTIARRLAQRLRESGHPVVVLDGDDFRRGVSKDTDFSVAGRTENLRRAREVAALIAASEVDVIAAFVSPQAGDRPTLAASTVLVHVDAPVEVCADRDVKGMWVKARRGEIPDFTGVSAPYDTPVADLVLRTDQQTVDKCVDLILSELKARRCAASSAI